MSITLTPELEADVLSRVGEGRFTDPMDVLSEAMRLLSEQEKLVKLRAMLKEAEEDVARGNVHEWTSESMAEIIAEADLADALGLPLDENFRP